MPARRPGACAQKSANHRLWAFTPSHRSRYSSALLGAPALMIDRG